MKRISIAALVSSCVLVSCGDMTSKVAVSAERTRTATEHAAGEAAQASLTKEANIAAQAAPLGAAEAVAYDRRYYLQEDGDKWVVMDRATESPATSGAEKLEELSREDAEKAIEDLGDEDYFTR